MLPALQDQRFYMGRCNAPPPSRQASIHSFPRGGGARNFWGSARRYTAHRRLSPRTNPRVACAGSRNEPKPRARSQIAKEPDARGRTAMRIKVCSGAALCQRICHIREQPIRSHRGVQPHHRDVNPAAPSLCQWTSHVRENSRQHRRHDVSRARRRSFSDHFSLPMDLTRPREVSRRKRCQPGGGSVFHSLHQELSKETRCADENPRDSFENADRTGTSIREVQSLISRSVSCPTIPPQVQSNPNNFGASEYGVSLDSEGDCDVSA